MTTAALGNQMHSQQGSPNDPNKTLTPVLNDSQGPRESIFSDNSTEIYNHQLYPSEVDPTASNTTASTGDINATTSNKQVANTSQQTVAHPQGIHISEDIVNDLLNSTAMSGVGRLIDNPQSNNGSGYPSDSTYCQQ